VSNGDRETNSLPAGREFVTIDKQGFTIDAESVEEPVDWQRLINTAQTVEFGTNFTVNLRQIELTPEQQAEISSEITQLMISKLLQFPNPIPNPGGNVDIIEGVFIRYERYMRT